MRHCYAGLLCMCLLSWPVVAAPDVLLPGEWQVALSVGIGETTTPLFQRDALQGVVVPAVSYYGERFYAENFSLGYSLLETEQVYLDVVGQFNDNGLFFVFDGKNDFTWLEVLNSSPGYGAGEQDPDAQFDEISRRLSYMAGLKAGLPLPYAHIKLSLLTDVTNVHHGQEAHLSINHTLNWQRASLNFSAALQYQSSQLNTYYYNLRPSELNNTDSWFTLEGSLNQEYAVTLNYQLSPTWTAQLHWQKYLLDADLLISPLIAKRKYYRRFIGVRYLF